MTDFIKKHKFDLILVGVIVLAIAICLLIFSLNQKDGAYAVVERDGEQTNYYPLDVNARISIADGDTYNVLVIENGTARIEKATCPDKLCVNQGSVSKNGESLVCLPNKVIVKIVSELDSEIDFIS